MFMKPKKSVVLSVLLAFLIALVVPFLVYNQIAKDIPISNWRPGIYVQILFPTLFLFPATYVLFLLKTIEINQDVWTVRYLFPRRELHFSKCEIVEIKKHQYKTYKYRIEVTTFTIQLRNSKSLKISSNEINDFDYLERILNKSDYKALTVKNKKTV